MEEPESVAFLFKIWEGVDLGDTGYVCAPSPNSKHRRNAIASGSSGHLVEVKNPVCNQGAGLLAGVL